MQNLKRNDTNELIYRTETDSEAWRTNLQFLGRMKGRDREFGMDVSTGLCLKWITNKDSLEAKGVCSKSCGRQDGRGVWGRMDTCLCVVESLCGSPETITLLIGYTPVQNKKFKRKKK